MALSSPSSSEMPDVSAVSVSPGLAVPMMVGWPVAGVFSPAAVLTHSDASPRRTR